MHQCCGSGGHWRSSCGHHRRGDRSTHFDDCFPPSPATFDAPVPCQLPGAERIGGVAVGEVTGKLCGHSRGAGGTLIVVVAVHVAENLSGMGDPEAVGECCHVKVVSSLVPKDQQVPFHPQDFVGVGTRTFAPDGSRTSTTPRGRVRISWRTPASMPPSSPRMILLGITLFVIHPSVLSTASRTTSKRSDRFARTCP